MLGVRMKMGKENDLELELLVVERERDILKSQNEMLIHRLVQLEDAFEQLVQRELRKLEECYLKGLDEAKEKLDGLSAKMEQLHEKNLEDDNDDGWKVVSHISSTSDRPRLGERFEKLSVFVIPSADLIDRCEKVTKTHAEVLNKLEEQGFSSRELNAMLLTLHDFDGEAVQCQLRNLIG